MKKCRALIFWVLIFLLIGCKKNEVIAPQVFDFDFYGIGKDPDDITKYKLINIDTVLATTGVTFKATVTKQDYLLKWKVGTDPREFTDDKFSLSFTDADTGTIVVNLKIYSTINNSLPNLVANVTKNLQVLPLYKNPTEYKQRINNILGQYRGYTVGEESDPYTIDIRYWYDAGNYLSIGYYSPFGKVSINNFPNGCTSTNFYSSITNNPMPNVGMEASSTCYNVLDFSNYGLMSHFGAFGYAQFDGKGNIIIEYSRDDRTKPWPWPTVRKTFKGKKL